MASCMGCFRRCCDGNVGGSYVQMKEQPLVLLDTSHMGQEVVIVKNGQRVCGTGATLANVPIVQNKAYFEMKLQQSGQEVVIVKNGQRVCGTGATLANVPIVQNKAYFEMKLQQSGQEVVIVKNGQRVCGTGATLANVPIVQNKAYFEMKLQQSGQEVVIVKNGQRVCGTGATLANVPIVQNKAYFEMKLQQSGQEVVIVKNGQRVCGTGAALANVPIVQNKAYFEMKLQQSGVWGVGLATRHADLNRVPLGRDRESWVLTSEGTITHNGEVLYKLSDMPMEGDIVGVSYDHVEINFFVNGKNLMCPVTGAKGEVFPVLYVDDGAILDAAFTTFTHQPPSGFDRILVEKSLL